MLDDLFESGAVLKHKGRELDKLLIVTAPGERIVLGCLALLLLGVAVVLAGGSVDRVVSLDGVVYHPEPDRSGRVALWVAPTLARSIDPGMAARIEVPSPNGATMHFQGETVAPSVVSLREQLGASLPWPIDGARIDVAIVGADAAVSPVPEGSLCRVRVSLGRQSLAGLLAFESS